MDTAIQNGQAPKPALFDEKGSAAGDRMFTTYDGYEALLPGDPTDSDLDTMLLRDGKARSLEQVLTLPLRWPKWTVDPAEGDSGEAELVRDALFRPANTGGMSTPFELVVAQMSSAVVHRRAFFEKVFQVRDGRIVFRKLAWRQPSTCKLLRDPKDQGFAGFEQTFTRNEERKVEKFAPDKALVYLHAPHRDPLNGASDLDTCWRVYDSKQKIRFLWLSFLENQVIPKATAQSGSADPAEAQKFAVKAATLKGGGVIGLTEGQSLTPFESSGTGADQFQAALDWLSVEQSQSVLASFTDLGRQGGSGGSYALSRNESDLFLRSRQAVLVEMGVAFTSWAAADLVRWNMGPEGKTPQVKAADLAEHDSDMARELFSALASSERLNPRIPTEFMDSLTELMAGHLGMDVDPIRKALDARRDVSPVEQMQSGVTAAVRLVQEAGVGQ